MNLQEGRTMALCKQTQSFEIVTWSGPCTSNDRITVTPQSGERVVFRGTDRGPKGYITWPSFRLDPNASSQRLVQRLYHETAQALYYSQSRWWRIRHRKMRDLQWFRQHIEFGLQLDDYDSEFDHKRTLAVGKELVVFFILDDKQIGWYSSKLPMYARVTGDMSEAIDRLEQDPVRSSSLIVSIK